MVAVAGVSEGRSGRRGGGGRLAGLLKNAEHPDARLHVLQCLDRAVSGLKSAERTRLAKALRADLDHERPFVRAWALSVLVRLAGETASIREWVGEAVEGAEADEKASVKARVRQLRKGGALDWFEG